MVRSAVFRSRASSFENAFLGLIEVELKHNGVRTRAKNRPEGWNLWLTFTISPVEATPAAPPRVVAK